MKPLDALKLALLLAGLLVWAFGFRSSNRAFMIVGVVFVVVAFVLRFVGRTGTGGTPGP